MEKTINKEVPEFCEADPTFPHKRAYGKETVDTENGPYIVTVCRTCDKVVYVTPEMEGVPYKRRPKKRW